MTRAGAIIAATMLVALFASADAPPDQYVSFSPGSQTISDKKTGLTWQRFITTGPMSKSQLSTACTQGTRLPTYRELLTLVDEDPHDEWDPDASASTPRYIDPNAFPGTPAGPFWSMSPNVNGGGTKGVDFASGATVNLNSLSSAYVRCVKP